MPLLTSGPTLSAKDPELPSARLRRRSTVEGAASRSGTWQHRCAQRRMHKGATVAKKKAKQHSLWKTEPDEHDYPAAYDNLTLPIPEKAGTKAGTGLPKTPTSNPKRKAILGHG